MLRGSGWANPALFEHAFRRRIEYLRKLLGRTAREYEFKRTPYGRQLITASYRYYGGYQKVCQNFGYGRPYVRQTRPPQGPPQPRPMYGFWTVREHQLTVLREHFSWYLQRGIFPAVSAVKPKFGGLACHWLRSPGGWERTAVALNLQTYTVGMPDWRTVEAIFETLDFIEHHQRFPHAIECSGRLRHRRFTTGIPWSAFMKQTNFHARLIEILLDRWKEHYRWCNQHDGTRLPEIQQTINSLIVQKSKLEPFGRSSP